MLRRPQLQRSTLLNHDYVERAFAFKASVISVLGDLSLARHLETAGHCFKVWLAAQPYIGWETLSEYMTLVPEQNNETTRANTAPTREALEAMLGSELEEVKANAMFPRWRPSRRARSVSVIIPFRDRPQVTLRAISSVSAQHFGGELEIVLVNNQSSETSLAVLWNGLQGLPKSMRVTRADYPKAFNHSRECNLGAEIAQGDVVMFLNNDAELVSPDLLDNISRWAELDGVATVGCRIESEVGTLVCAGLKARLNAGYDYHSMIEENRDPEYAHLIREVIGNTFACAAIRRDRFFQIGALDELDFPIGYNDVEFCLRAVQKNYRHLYLGHLVLRHEPGTSRGKSDEIYQKILIRERHPWVIREGMFQFEKDTHLLSEERSTHLFADKPPGQNRTSNSKRVGRLLRQSLRRFVQR
jgi:GT2 family glycosyltransferase